MKNIPFYIYFNIGVDLIGFPVIWKHIVHNYERHTAFGVTIHQSVRQELI